MRAAATNAAVLAMDVEFGPKPVVINCFTQSIVDGSNEVGFVSNPFLFSPGFSPVEKHSQFKGNRFNGFQANMRKTVETVFCQCPLFGTGLKPGENKKGFWGKAYRNISSVSFSKARR